MEGPPWCAGCTAQLSDDDLHSPGLRDPANPNTRYRLRGDRDHLPTHSNLHNDLILIHRTNADYHRSQSNSEELQQVTHGILPDYRPLTTDINTPSAANLNGTIERYQYDRGCPCHTLSTDSKPFPRNPDLGTADMQVAVWASQ